MSGKRHMSAFVSEKFQYQEKNSDDISLKEREVVFSYNSRLFQQKTDFTMKLAKSDLLRAFLKKECAQNTAGSYFFISESVFKGGIPATTQ